MNGSLRMKKVISMKNQKQYLIGCKAMLRGGEAFWRRAGIDAGLHQLTSAASGYVCPVDHAAEPFVVGMVVAPDDVPANHAGLLFVAGVVSAVQGEITQRRELRFYAV